MAIRVVAIPAVLAAGLVSACGGSGGTETGSSPAEAWAQEVCTNVSTLTTSVSQLGSSITVDLKADASGLDQAKAQLASQADTIKSDVSALAAAVTDVPSGSSSDVSAAAQQLEQDKQSLQSSVQELGMAGSQLGGATDAVGVVNGFAALRAAFAQTEADLEAFTSSVQTAASSGAASVRAAFAAAPACSTYASGS
jgi:hypothetical protein